MNIVLFLKITIKLVFKMKRFESLDVHILKSEKNCSLHKGKVIVGCQFTLATRMSVHLQHGRVLPVALHFGLDQERPSL